MRQGKDYFDEVYPLRFWRQRLSDERLELECGILFLEAVAAEAIATKTLPRIWQDLR